MKQPSALLKLAAVVSSLVLFGGFVSYRAGAFHWLAEPSPRPAVSQSSPTGQENPAAATTELAPTIMSSSKSIVIAPASAYAPSAQPAITPQQPPADAEQRPPTVMYGSKSGIFAPAPSSPVPPPPTPSEQPIPPQVPTKPTVMSGSKAPFGPLIQLPATDPPSSRPPVANQPSKPSP